MSVFKLQVLPIIIGEFRAIMVKILEGYILPTSSHSFLRYFMFKTFLDFSIRVLTKPRVKNNTGLSIVIFRKIVQPKKMTKKSEK